MEEEVKIIEIPNFITIKIVKINEKHCSYYVEDYNNEYFYANENGYLKTQPKIISFWALSIDMPMIIGNISIKYLEEDIYRLHKELDKELHKKLTKGKLIRAERGELYYTITSDFNIIDSVESNHSIDNQRYIACNYFLSKIQAKQFASKLQNYIIELWKEELKGE